MNKKNFDATLLLASIAGVAIYKNTNEKRIEEIAVFYIGDDRVMDIMTYEDFIDINGTQYNMVKNELSLDKIDEFIESIK